MVLSKRERVIRTLELDGELDVIPIHYLGFEPTCTAYHDFLKSEEYSKNKTHIKNNFSRQNNDWVGDITAQRFFNVDLDALDPFKTKIKKTLVSDIPEHPGCLLKPWSGKVIKPVSQVKTGQQYLWYVNGLFKTPEKLYSTWDIYGKPSELIIDDINYSPKVWDEFVNSLTDYFYPMASLPIAMHEALFEGMTMGRLAYYIRKNPRFIHDVMKEYAKTNIEIVKRFAEAGVDIVFYYDDLGFKGRSLLSPKNFREFILPYYKKLYSECKKRGMFIVQHSCGYIDNLLPDMVDAGLNCIQALEPTAGVDLARLKEDLGDRISFMGGMDSSRVLNFGTPQEIEEDVKKCVKAAAKGGGYFAGPSHNILSVPWQNVLALRAAIEKYRKYPINFI